MVLAFFHIHMGFICLFKLLPVIKCFKNRA